MLSIAKSLNSFDHRGILQLTSSRSQMIRFSTPAFHVGCVGRTLLFLASPLLGFWCDMCLLSLLAFPKTMLALSTLRRLRWGEANSIAGPFSRSLDIDSRSRCISRGKGFAKLWRFASSGVANGARSPGFRMLLVKRRTVMVLRLFGAVLLGVILECSSWHSWMLLADLGGISGCTSNAFEVVLYALFGGLHRHNIGTGSCSSITFHRGHSKREIPRQVLTVSQCKNPGLVINLRQYHPFFRASTTVLTAPSVVPSRRILPPKRTGI